MFKILWKKQKIDAQHTEMLTTILKDAAKRNWHKGPTPTKTQVHQNWLPLTATSKPKGLSSHLFSFASNTWESLTNTASQTQSLSNSVQILIQIFYKFTSHLLCSPLKPKSTIHEDHPGWVFGPAVRPRVEKPTFCITVLRFHPGSAGDVTYLQCAHGEAAGNDSNSGVQQHSLSCKYLWFKE